MVAVSRRAVCYPFGRKHATLVGEASLLMRFNPTQITTIIAAGIALATSVTSAYYTYTSRSRELDIELIKLGVSILQAAPKTTQKDGKTQEDEGLRGWAIGVIEKFSERPLSPVAREQLQRLGFDPRFGPIPDAQVPVHLVKSALAYRGFYSGLINDKNDDALREAVSKFQKSQNIPVDGNLSPPTLGALAREAPDYLAPSRRLREYPLIE
jgi:Putative peptidoglycan binding domain